MRLLVAVLISVLASGTIPGALAQDAQCIFDAHQDAVVQIEYNYSTSNDGDGTEHGTGFIVSPDGHVITSAHVVSPNGGDIDIHAEKIVIRQGTVFNEPVEATLIARDIGNDLALLKLASRQDELDWPTLDIGRAGSLPVGSPLVGLGFSSSDLAIVPVALKTANSAVVDKVLKPWWQTSLSLNSGNSGGPVFGSLGTVVGVAVAVRADAQLVTYVIPISFAQHLLDAAGVRSVAAGRCAVYPECRHEKHGVESYGFDERLTGPPGSRSWSSCTQHGNNSKSRHCSSRKDAILATYPDAVLSDEVGDEEQCGNRLTEYKFKYTCSIRVQRDPVFRLMQSEHCLRSGEQ
jgi:S1-C subfamily serine protease